MAITPGYDFGAYRAGAHVRFSYANRLDMLQDGCEGSRSGCVASDNPRTRTSSKDVITGFLLALFIFLPVAAHSSESNFEIVVHPSEIAEAGHADIEPAQQYGDQRHYAEG